jgi:hypothetical protein
VGEFAVLFRLGKEDLLSHKFSHSITRKHLEINTLTDFLHIFFPFGDTLSIDPGVQVIGGQSIHDLLGEVKVFAGIGDKDVGHKLFSHIPGASSFLVNLR